MAEWSKAPVWRAGWRVTVTRVRIPISPQDGNRKRAKLAWARFLLTDWTAPPQAGRDAGGSQPDGIRRDWITLAESGEIGLRLWNPERLDCTCGICAEKTSWAGLVAYIITLRLPLPHLCKGTFVKRQWNAYAKPSHNPLSKKTALTRLQANISLSHQKQVCKQTP